MKIAIDLTSLSYHMTGIERYAACMTEEMLKIDAINEYILILSKKQGYFVSSHVCGDNIIIGTNVDIKCKPNHNNINTISLPNSIKIIVFDPDC